MEPKGIMSAILSSVLVKSTNATSLPKTGLPYRRERALERLDMFDFQPHERLGIITLQVMFGERAALQTILRVRRKLRHALQVERWRGMEGSWLYDIARHMNLSYCLREETKLARHLIAVHFAARRIAR
jgi:hypothetical protein